MKKRNNLWTILIIVAVVLVVGGLLVAKRQAASSAGEQDLQTAVVGRGTLSITVTASGSIEPDLAVNLGFDLPGRVAEVNVDLGDYVQQGQVLGRLDTTDLERCLRQHAAQFWQKTINPRQGITP